MTVRGAPVEQGPFATELIQNCGRAHLSTFTTRNGRRLRSLREVPGLRSLFRERFFLQLQFESLKIHSIALLD